MATQKHKRIAAHLQSLLLDRGRSARWLAREAGVSESYISRFVSGTARPSSELLRTIAQVLQVDYTDLAVRAGYADPYPADELRDFAELLPLWRQLAEQDRRVLLLGFREQAEAAVRGRQRRAKAGMADEAAS